MKRIIFDYTAEDLYEDIQLEYDDETDEWLVYAHETSYDAGRAKVKMTNLAVLAMAAAILEEFQGETIPPSGASL